MIGQTISHYKILEKLGEGGMGVVYKAEDTKLDRLVALKFLPAHLSSTPENKARFIQEAKTASALDHPSICAIHEIDETPEGQLFIVMPAYDGVTLSAKLKSGPLRLDKAVHIAIQVAEGLKAAHEKGIVHRDIKSSNIIVTDNGQAKIMDFGLARRGEATQLTKTGVTLGTVPYMSPEQSRGEKVDKRTDIWSLGVVLYEMITGRLPFAGDYEQAIVYRILNEDPEPITNFHPNLPIELKQIVEKTMAKSPDWRYQQLEEMLADLKNFTSQLSRPQPVRKTLSSIAVLPFVNMSADAENEYFCDGLAEELLNALAKIESLRVAARTSAFSFKGKETDVREIGRKLNVSTVLEGSVRKAGDRLRITAQLITVADGYHLWSERYDRQMDDIFDIQDEISLAIVDALKVKLLGAEKAVVLKRYTENTEAYILYLKARNYMGVRTLQGFEKAIESLEEAVKRDPNYAYAYTGLSDCYHLLENWGYIHPTVAWPKSKEYASRALTIDDSLPEAHTSMAMALAILDWNWSAAEDEYRRALALNPNYVTAHHWYATHFLVAQGRLEQAIGEMEKAHELDPFSPVIATNLGRVLFLSGRREDAKHQYRLALELNPSFAYAHVQLGMALISESSIEEGNNEIAAAASLSPDFIEAQAALANVYATSGRIAEAERILHDLKSKSNTEYVPTTWIGVVCGALGDYDQAFEWLGRAIRDHSSTFPEYYMEPIFDPLRSDPRYTALLKKMGLEK